MKFFFPDSQDQVDPLFDMEKEEHSPHRVRQRDDLYAHEALSSIPFDGLLVSKAIVDGWSQAAGKYSAAQRARFYREGVRGFFRLRGSEAADRVITLGDCGAFAYVEEDVPPFSADDVIDFYDSGGFDMGVSPDHVILGFDMETDDRLPGVDMDPRWVERQQLTIELAAEFLRRHRDRGCSFVPVGAAQGWSPRSYAQSVAELQRIGYERIAIGGMVPLKTHQIVASLQAISIVRAPTTQLHLLGVTRVEHLATFSSLGVTSFDSTSPFRQAFMDAEDNYHWFDENYIAVRVPQVDGNTRLKMEIRAGRVSQAEALKAEEACLDALRAYGREEVAIAEVLEALVVYDSLLGKKDQIDAYRRTLEARRWDECECGICSEVGVNVVIFRGSERNKRRGFHNLHVFGRRLASVGSLERVQ